MIMNPTLAISDLNLAATLVALGHEPIELDRADRRRVQFIFKKTPEAEKVINDYWTNAVSIPPQILFNAQKALKSRIYSGV